MNMRRLLPLMLMACMALSSCGLLNLVTANQVKTVDLVFIIMRINDM